MPDAPRPALHIAAFPPVSRRRAPAPRRCLAPVSWLGGNDWHETPGYDRSEPRSGGAAGRERARRLPVEGGAAASAPTSPPRLSSLASRTSSSPIYPNQHPLALALAPLVHLRAAHRRRRTPRGRRSGRRWPARRLAYGAWSTARWPPTPASTTTSASRGSRERSSGQHLRRGAARRRRAHQVGRPRLRHAARPRERRRTR
jgi:hypothetical protein